MITLDINYQLKMPQINEALFKKSVKLAAREFKKSSWTVSLVFVGDSAIKYLNNRYRGKNNPTDVLSFNELEEIIIDYSQAKRQLKGSGRKLEQELVFLFIHGLLHLLGMDHKTDREEKKMNALTEKIISRL